MEYYNSSKLSLIESKDLRSIIEEIFSYVFLGDQATGCPVLRRGETFDFHSQVTTDIDSRATAFSGKSSIRHSRCSSSVR